MNLSRRDLLTYGGFIGFISGVWGIALITHLSNKKSKSNFKNYETHPVDQLVRDFDGYRVFFTDEEGIVRERRYRDNGTKNVLVETIKRPLDVPEEVCKNFQFFNINYGKEVIVIKDLDEGSRGLAKIINYSIDGGFFGASGDKTYAEIYLPKTKNFKAGSELISGKF